MIKQGAGNSGKLVIILLVVIVILLAVIAYTFAIKPAMDGYVIKKQTEAIESIINLMILQVQQQGFTQISNRDANVSLILVPYIPPQEQAQ